MKNENFRNFNVCGKATASQKEIYRKKADEAGLTLSEWIVTTLDIYLEQEKIKERKKNQLVIKKNYEKEELVYYYCKESINQKFTEENNRNHNSKEVKLNLDKEIIQLKSVSNSFYQIGILAYIGAMFLGK
jgi:hypothetical protein